MVSTFRYNSFKKLDLRKRWSYRAFVPFAAILLLFLFIPRAGAAGARPSLHPVGAGRRPRSRACAPGAGHGPRAPRRPWKEPAVTAIAILHPMNLLGKELRETLERLPRVGGDIRLLSTREDEIGTLTEVAGAAAMVTRYEPERLEGGRRRLPLRPDGGEPADPRRDAGGDHAILLSFDATRRGRPSGRGGGQHRGRAGASRAALAASGGGAARPSPPSAARPRALEAAAATLIQPASMRDEAGIEELFEQTRQIVAMTRRTPTPVFGAQLSFNLLPTLLPADPVAAQLAAVMAGSPPRRRWRCRSSRGRSSTRSRRASTCAARAIPSVQAIRKALAGHAHLEAADKPRLLGPIDAAASDKVLFGSVRKDEAGGGFWLWAVMDNLIRGGALNAIEIAEAVS